MELALKQLRPTMMLERFLTPARTAAECVYLTYVYGHEDFKGHLLKKALHRVMKHLAIENYLRTGGTNSYFAKVVRDKRGI